MERTQQMFDWAKNEADQLPQRAHAKTGKNDSLEQQIVAPPNEAQFDPDATLPPAVARDGPDPDKRVPPVAQPLPDAVAHGVFGWTTEGPIEPDAEDVLSITTEHSHELRALLIDLDVVQDAARNGCDPRTGKLPRTPEAATQMKERCQSEEQRLKQTYADALAAYAEGFGQAATDLLDAWMRQHVAGPPASTNAYDPSHPWHYLPAGDGAAPIRLSEIPPDEQAGRYLEAAMPKNPKKRRERTRELLDQERERLAEDKQCYLDVIERGAKALSRYDREIAYTNDEIAVASTLALKYRHISLGLGRIAWLEEQIATVARDNLFGEPG